MNRPNSLLIGQIALEQNLLTREQLQECLDLQAGQVQPKPIGTLLVESKLITEVQLLGLMAEQGRRLRAGSPYMPAQTEEIAFGRLVVKGGHVKPEQVNEALRAQQDMADRGQRKRLGEMLVDSGHLDAAVVPKILKLQGKTLMACTFCGAHFNVLTTIAQGYPCRKCGMPLSDQTGAIDALESAYLLPAVDPRTQSQRLARPPVEPSPAPPEAKPEPNPLAEFWRKVVIVVVTTAIIGVALYFLTREK